MVVFRRGYWA
jgi:hypothetical protein